MGELVNLKEYKKKMPLKAKFNRFYQKYFVIPYGYTRIRTAVSLPIFSLMVLLINMNTYFSMIGIFKDVKEISLLIMIFRVGVAIACGTINILVWEHYYKYFRCRVLDWYCDNEYFLGWGGLATITAVASILCCILIKSTLLVIIIASVLLVAVAVLDILIMANIPITFSVRNPDRYKKSNRRKYN